MSDSATREEINRINAISVKSDFERVVTKEIMAWCEKNNINYHNSPKIAVNEFWTEQLG